jgi:hypothetical protein
MLIISIRIIHFINQITTTTTLYEKHNIHERYTYQTLMQEHLWPQAICINPKIFQV